MTDAPGHDRPGVALPCPDPLTKKARREFGGFSHSITHQDNASPPRLPGTGGAKAPRRSPRHMPSGGDWRVGPVRIDVEIREPGDVVHYARARGCAPTPV